MGRIFDFDHSPRIKAATNLLTADIDHGIGTDNGKGNGIPQPLNLLFEFLIFITKNMLFLKKKRIKNIIQVPIALWEGVDFDVIVLDFLQDFLL